MSCGWIAIKEDGAVASYTRGAEQKKNLPSSKLKSIFIAEGDKHTSIALAHKPEQCSYVEHHEIDLQDGKKCEDGSYVVKSKVIGVTIKIPNTTLREKHFTSDGKEYKLIADSSNQTLVLELDTKGNLQITSEV